MDFKTGMVCPVCEAGELELIRKDIDFDYKGKKAWIQNQSVFECNKCKESFLNNNEERILEKELTDLRRRLDGLLTSDEIRKIRNNFNMTQVDFAKALRIGEKNIARYECGQSTQSYAMDDLLRILQKFPNTINTFYDNWVGVENDGVIDIKAVVKKRKSKPMRVSNDLFCTMKEVDLEGTKNAS